MKLREQIVALAQRHRPYGVGMIHLKLRQAWEVMVVHCMGGEHFTRILDGICSQRGQPAVCEPQR